MDNKLILSYVNKKTLLLLFYVFAAAAFLKIVLIIATGSFLGIIYFTKVMSWVLLFFYALLFWLFYLYVFKSQFSPKSLSLIFIVGAIAIGSIGFGSKSISFNSDVNKKASIESIPPQDEWIWYSGAHSNIFTFKYPKGYFIHDSSGAGSVQVFSSEAENNRGGDHLTITWYPRDEKNPYSIVEDCTNFAKGMGEAQDNSIGKDYKLRYSKATQLGSIKVCDYGISLIQMDDVSAGRMYEFSIDFTANKTNFAMIGYAEKENGLDIFHEIAQTFRHK